jgi:hypothetical protein
MSFRHCPRCGTEVEDAGGYCLLGHPLRLSAPVDSLKELRAEVDRALADVKAEAVEMLQTVSVGAAAGPPPPPPTGPHPGTFSPLQREADESTDPLEDFAPPPRMDWGPERGLLRRKP